MKAITFLRFFTIALNLLALIFLIINAIPSISYSDEICDRNLQNTEVASQLCKTYRGLHLTHKGQECIKDLKCPLEPIYIVYAIIALVFAMIVNMISLVPKISKIHKRRKALQYVAAILMSYGVFLCYIPTMNSEKKCKDMMLENPSEFLKCTSTSYEVSNSLMLFATLLMWIHICYGREELSSKSESTPPRPFKVRVVTDPVEEESNPSLPSP